MLSLSPRLRVFVAMTPVSMRGSFDALAGHARRLGLDPVDGHVYLFMAKNRRFQSPFFWPGHRVTTTASDLVHELAPAMKDPLHTVKSVGKKLGESLLGLLGNKPAASQPAAH